MNMPLNLELQEWSIQSHLTMHEREQIAFANGDITMAQLLREMIDISDEKYNIQENIDERIDQAYEKGVEEGKREADKRDPDTRIQALKKELQATQSIAAKDFWKHALYSAMHKQMLEFLESDRCAGIEGRDFLLKQIVEMTASANGKKPAPISAH